jgi:hypothetical protein
MNLVFDQWVDGRPYPNLAPLIDLSNGYSELELNYPRVVPLRLLYFFNDHGYPYSTFDINSDFPINSYYPVGLGFFDFDIDYFELMSALVLELLQQGRMRVLFYYHEGDNPYHEKARLTDLCKQHQLPDDCYRFVSGNTQAENIDNFIYFPDHELFYWRCSRDLPRLLAHSDYRSKDFTLLSRRHQSWRATVVSFLRRENLLDRSFWSYGLVGNDSDDPLRDNPISILHEFPGLTEYIKDFIAGAPYSCDQLTETQHNQHDLLVAEHFGESYCNLVLETLFDADQSQGVFITEKTFKPIRNGQPFIIFGCAHTLATLKKLGYRTFDSYIDNSYDSVEDNAERFKLLAEQVRRLKYTDLHAWYQQCQADTVHNQQLFYASKAERLSMLEQELLS